MSLDPQSNPREAYPQTAYPSKRETPTGWQLTNQESLQSTLQEVLAGQSAAERLGNAGFPQYAPASWPQIAPVVSASFPRLTPSKGLPRRSWRCETPKSRFKTLDHPSRALDLRRLPCPETSPGDVQHFRVQGLTACNCFRSASPAKGPRHDGHPESGRRRTTAR